MLIYISHVSPLDDGKATGVASAIAPHSEVTVYLSQFFGSTGTTIKPGLPYRDRESALSQTSLFIILYPHGEPGPDIARIAFELAQYLGIRKGNRPQVVLLHHPDSQAIGIEQLVDQKDPVPAESGNIAARLMPLIDPKPADEVGAVNSILVALDAIPPRLRREFGTALSISLSKQQYADAVERGILDNEITVGGTGWFSILGVGPQQGG